MKRILVVGRTGQVAQALAERGGGRANIIAIGRPELDIARDEDVSALLAKKRPDAIVNAAAFTAVDVAEDEPATAWAVNSSGAARVAEAAARLQVPFVHLSTDYVFDGASARPYRENDIVGPQNAYGRSKLDGERQVAAVCPDHVIVRTAWVYSPFGTNFVRTMLRLGETKASVRVVADQYGNPTSALDLAECILLIAERLCEDGSHELRGVVHVTGSGATNWADFAAAVFREAEKGGRRPVTVEPIATCDFPTKAQRPANSRLDTGKAARLFGVRLPDWRASLPACVERLLR